MNRLTQSKSTTILPVLIALTLACLALSPQARAACQEGCLTNDNTILGDNALINNTTGMQNTATGASALQSNTTGNFNTATGVGALGSNTVGFNNTAIGALALFTNTRGAADTAIGSAALLLNENGDFNTATGQAALQNNTMGDENTATGFAALLSNTTGENNTAFGLQALHMNLTGDDNTAIGHNALRQSTGSSNIALGSNAGGHLTTGNHNIYIGNSGSAASESGKIRIGTVGMQNRTFIAGISGANVPDGVGVIVGSDGRLGTVVSSARFKDAIKPMDKASEAIHALKPVTFRYKKEIDPAGIPQFGLVAEEVEAVHPDLIVRDNEGRPYSVRYEAVNAMLLNELLKEHKKVQKLETALAEQEKKIEALAAGLQKVSARLETNQAAPKMIVSNQ